MSESCRYRQGEGYGACDDDIPPDNFSWGARGGILSIRKEYPLASLRSSSDPPPPPERREIQGPDSRGQKPPSFPGTLAPPAGRDAPIPSHRASPAPNGALCRRSFPAPPGCQPPSNPSKEAPSLSAECFLWSGLRGSSPPPAPREGPTGAALRRSPASPDFDRRASAAGRGASSLLRKRSRTSKPDVLLLMERATRLELATSTLARWRSTR